MRILVLVLSMAVMAGCSQTNLAEVIAALAKDPATACVTVMTPQGSGKIYRTNIKNGMVKCTDDGMAVASPTPAQ